MGWNGREKVQSGLEQEGTGEKWAVTIGKGGKNGRSECKYTREFRGPSVALQRVPTSLSILLKKQSSVVVRSPRADFRFVY